MRKMSKCLFWTDGSLFFSHDDAHVFLQITTVEYPISRLTASNQAFSTQITQLETSTKLSTSSTAPLQFENSRLKTELSALTAHCTWLEEELNNRSNQSAEEKLKNLKLIQELRNELNEIRADYDEAISKVSILGMQNETQRKRVEMGQKELLQKETERLQSINEKERESLQFSLDNKLITQTDYDTKLLVLEDSLLKSKQDLLYHNRL